MDQAALVYLTCSQDIAKVGLTAGAASYPVADLWRDGDEHVNSGTFTLVVQLNEPQGT